MTLRSDIHAALDDVTPSAPHLPTTALEAALRGDRPARRPRRGLLVAAAAALMVVLAGGVVAVRLGSAPGTTSPAAPPTQLPTGLVVTTWVRDPSIVTGPYPGYRPQVRMDQRSVAGAHAVQNTTTGTWLVLVRFEPDGQRLFGSITAAVHACSAGACPQNHVTMWLDLTPDDVAHWNERATKLYASEGQGGKLLSDAVLRSSGASCSTTCIEGPIGEPETIVAGGLSQHDAEVLARRLDRVGG